MACKQHGFGHAPQGAAQGWWGKLWSCAAPPSCPAPGARPSLCAGRMDKDSWGVSAAGETLASRWPPPRHRGRNPPPRAGLSLGIPGVQGPHGPEQVQPRGSVQTATYCPLARTWAARPGRSCMCPRLLSQPCCPAARVRGAGFGAGARWGLTGQQGETGSPGTAIYKLAFYFGRLLSSSSPSAGRKKAPLSRCRMSWGRALTHTMGQLMCPASGGPAAGLQWGAAATSTHAATQRHGLPCQE